MGTGVGIKHKRAADGQLGLSDATNTTGFDDKRARTGSAACTGFVFHDPSQQSALLDTTSGDVPFSAVLPVRCVLLPSDSIATLL